MMPTWQLSAFIPGHRAIQAWFLMAAALALHESPQLVQFEPVGANANHHAVM
jgi:hypothetical protein